LRQVEKQTMSFTSLLHDSFQIFYHISSCISGGEHFVGGGYNMGNLEKGVFGYLWNSPAPSKVMAFSWKLLRVGRNKLWNI